MNRKFLFVSIIVLMFFTILISCNNNAFAVTDIVKYNVVFLSDGKTVMSVEVEKGSTIAKPVDPIKEGYTFIGWKVEGKNDLYSFDLPVNGDMSLVAVWEKSPQPIEKVTVTFDTAGGSSVSSIEIEKGKTIAKPADPIKEGFLFKGWKLKDAITFFDFTSIIDNDITLYAEWEPEKTFTVSFYDGEKLIETRNCVYDVPQKFPSINVDDGFTVKWKAEGSYDYITDSTFTISYSGTDYKFYTYIATELLEIDNSGKVKGSYELKNSSSINSISIPRTIKGITVIGIGSEAFKNFTGLTSITIPSTVTTIGENAFSGCSGLTSITIPNSITSIGDSAFSGCSGLTSITIPNSITSIGDYAFSDCTGLAGISIPNSVSSIGNRAFSGCSSLYSITIPDSVSSLGNEVFSYCDNLTRVTIGNKVTSLGDGIFEYCPKLSYLSLGSSITSISGYAFYKSKALGSITLSSSIEYIDNNAFIDCGIITIKIAKPKGSIAGAPWSCTLIDGWAKKHPSVVWSDQTEKF